MTADIGTDHPLLEVGGEVEDVVDDAELVGHPASVLGVGHRTAPRVGAATPQLEGGTHDVLGPETLDQEGGGDRRVHATGHGHEHAHGSVP